MLSMMSVPLLICVRSPLAAQIKANEGVTFRNLAAFKQVSVLFHLMSSFDTNSGAPIVPERRRYYCDEELLSYRDTTPAFTRTARGAIAGEASTSVSPMQHTHTLKGGRSAYRHFKFGYLTGTKHFADSESALRGGPYGTYPSTDPLLIGI
jgi:hypothetical protein